MYYCIVDENIRYNTFRKLVAKILVMAELRVTERELLKQPVILNDNNIELKLTKQYSNFLRTQ